MEFIGVVGDVRSYGRCEKVEEGVLDWNAKRDNTHAPRPRLACPGVRLLLMLGPCSPESP